MESNSPQALGAITQHMKSMSKEESDIYGWMCVLDQLAQGSDDIGVAIEMISSRIKYHMEGISDGRHAIDAIARNGVTESGEPVWDQSKRPDEANH